jgi:hypothetical protein
VGTIRTNSEAKITRGVAVERLVATTSSTPKGSITAAEEQYIHLRTVVTRYLEINFLNHTIYIAETHAELRIRILPHALEC